jgi:phage replication O-like protein O
MSQRFRGFRGPNYTQVPDELFDDLLADLSGAELKVLLYVMRRTFGFKKGSDRISKSQLENGITRANGDTLDRGTGLSRRAIRLAIQSLVAKNILLKRSRSSARHGDEATEYGLNVIGQDPWVQSTHGDAPRGVQSTHAVGRRVPPQDTVDKKDVNVGTRPREEDGRAPTRPQQSSLSSDELDYLARTIADATADHNPISLRTFRRIASSFGRNGVFELLGVVNEASRDKLIATNKGRYLVGVAKRIAKERGLNLQLRTSRMT